jgi:flagellar transcriptional activator FlhD
MNMHDMQTEMRDANLNYLMLAQQMIRADRACAIFRLGIDVRLADFLDGLSNLQILKMADMPLMLARLRFEDPAVLAMLTSSQKEPVLAKSHAAILLAGFTPDSGH